MSVRISANMMGVESLYDGSARAQIEIAKIGDRMGIDLISVSDHLLVSRSAVEEGKYLNGAKFPYGHLDWYEPAVSLGAIAAVTERIRLTTAIMIGPLRSAPLLAKQLATIDALSGGRIEVALGAGWMDEEFEGSNISMEGRFGYLEEQVEACRKLWTESGYVSYHGKRTQLNEVYAKPQPVQAGGVPVLLGLLPSERNIERMARVADGWAAPPLTPDVFGVARTQLLEAVRRAGRDSDRFQCRAPCFQLSGVDGKADIGKLLDVARAFIVMGADTLDFPVALLCRHRDEIEPLFERLLSLKTEG
jgi:probable F420-dependent oxidoreductase